MEERQLTEAQLQALLRVKRHEQPPPGYFDDLLANIQRRQREDLLRRPAWRLFLDRVRGFFSSMDWNYAGAMAVVLLVGLVTIRLALPNNPQKNNAPAMADLTGSGRAGITTVNAPTKVTKPGTPGKPGNGTRFVIEPMPASYEPAPIGL